ncbi:MAG: DNA-protecting protein DprA, partial [Deltaproteobacteria bacterium]
MEDKLFWLALNMVSGVGPIAYRNLLARFQDPQGVFTASIRELTAVEGIGEKTARAIKNFPVQQIAAEELKRAENLGVSILTSRDKGYPQNLLQIHDPPPLLYVRGELKEGDSLAIAIVGSRKVSPYGRAMTKRISKELSAVGVTVVSGMARG